MAFLIIFSLFAVYNLIAAYGAFRRGDMTSMWVSLLCVAFLLGAIFFKVKTLRLK